MNATDTVDLIFLTKHGCFMPVTVSRQLASDSIEKWCEGRDGACHTFWLIRLAYRFWDWLLYRPYTLAFLFKVEKEDKLEDEFVTCAVDPRQIMGMFIRDKIADPHAVLAQAQKRIADAIERQEERIDDGEQWREGYNPDEGDE